MIQQVWWADGSRKEQAEQVLTAATLGLAAFGLYSVGYGLADMLIFSRLEIVVSLGHIVFGLLLMLAAAFVRVLIPGGLWLAIGALLALQAIAIHDAAHFHGTVALLPQLLRGGLALALVLLAAAGAMRETKSG